jgi:hypothetical protein
MGMSMGQIGNIVGDFDGRPTGMEVSVRLWGLWIRVPMMTADWRCQQVIRLAILVFHRSPLISAKFVSPSSDNY